MLTLLVGASVGTTCRGSSPPPPEPFPQALSTFRAWEPITVQGPCEQAMDGVMVEATVDDIVWHEIGLCHESRFSGTFPGLAPGEYSLLISYATGEVLRRVEDENGFGIRSGVLILAGGQSNFSQIMETWDGATTTLASAFVADQATVAESLKRVSDPIVPSQWQYIGGSAWGRFADLAVVAAGMPLGLIQVSWPGTSICEWGPYDPSDAWCETSFPMGHSHGDLYDRMISHVEKATGGAGCLDALFFMQGVYEIERAWSEVPQWTEAEIAANWGSKFRLMVNALEDEYDSCGGLPIYVFPTADLVGSPESDPWYGDTYFQDLAAAVRTEQYLVAAEDPNDDVFLGPNTAGWELRADGKHLGDAAREDFAQGANKLVPHIVGGSIPGQEPSEAELGYPAP